MSLDINDPNPHLRPMADFLNNLGSAQGTQGAGNLEFGIPGILQPSPYPGPSWPKMTREAIERAISAVCEASGSVAPEERAAMDAALRALLKARRHVESVLWPKVK